MKFCTLKQGHITYNYFSGKTEDQKLEFAESVNLSPGTTHQIHASMLLSFVLSQL